MKITFYGGLTYAKCGTDEIEKKPFKWGNDLINPGHIFDRIGQKDRSSLNLTDAKLKYYGRCDKDVFFSILPIIQDGKNCENGQLSLFDKESIESAEQGWFICATIVDNTTLLMQGSSNGFWDIRL